MNTNRPFPISPHSLFQRESKSEIFVMVVLISIGMKTGIHDKECARRLVFKERLRGSFKASPNMIGKIHLVAPIG